MATAPPPKPIEEIEKEIKAEEAKAEVKTEATPTEKPSSEGKESK